MNRIILLIICTILILGACSSNHDKQFDSSVIDQNLENIVSNTKVSKSSNPMDYISENQELYDEIINTGNQGFTYLKNKLKESPTNGLTEWIIAKACDDILKDKKVDVQWESGKDWLNKYELMNK
ncbi:hypothetical protein [Paenibacillus sp. YIM B09110]|uniref:hypothetical protein n=1 Tax=Paenibacillus sp. YIM B09110 TaxID=3126102 RepID=UPI00301E3875